MSSPVGPTSGEQVFLSVVIRVRNEAASLRQVLTALNAQQSAFPWELIVVDNESTDGTRELCAAYGARIVSLSREQFTYGRALNVGITHARGELVLLLSAHALPVGSYFFEAAVAPFTDPAVAAARCLMVNNREQLVRWFTPRDIYFESPSEQQEHESGLQWLADYPAATCCVLRRRVWQELPFDEHLEANEDKVWASRVLSKGFKIRSCSEAVYVYSLKGGRLTRWRKQSREFRSLYRMRGYVPLTWPQFLSVVTKAIIRTPIVATRHVVDTVGPNLWLVTIPWQAKSEPQPGSVPGFGPQQDRRIHP